MLGGPTYFSPMAAVESIRSLVRSSDARPKPRGARGWRLRKGYLQLRGLELWVEMTRLSNYDFGGERGSARIFILKEKTRTFEAHHRRHSIHCQDFARFRCPCSAKFGTKYWRARHWQHCPLWYIFRDIQSSRCVSSLPTVGIQPPPPLNTPQLSYIQPYINCFEIIDTIQETSDPSVNTLIYSPSRAYHGSQKVKNGWVRIPNQEQRKMILHYIEVI
ncbi:hypothetical protein DFH27DRAFT_229031 [Peziza echinospora]|nr:hypothetical protein DFH27DRAFT_229031 [Peziza echinospora]